MVRSHAGQAYTYQILTALFYLLKNNLDAFSIEGDNFEDSLFYKDNALVAIGEAKHIPSKKYWTSKDLFYIGNKSGPLLQLWNKARRDTKLVLFSSIPLRKDLKGNYYSIKIDNSELKKIVREVKERFKKIKNLGQFNSQNLIKFLKRIEFFILL